MHLLHVQPKMQKQFNLIVVKSKNKKSCIYTLKQKIQISQIVAQRKAINATAYLKLKYNNNNNKIYENNKTHAHTHAFAVACSDDQQPATLLTAVQVECRHKDCNKNKISILH